MYTVYTVCRDTEAFTHKRNGPRIHLQVFTGFLLLFFMVQVGPREETSVRSEI